MTDKTESGGWVDAGWDDADEAAWDDAGLDDDLDAEADDDFDEDAFDGAAFGAADDLGDEPAGGDEDQNAAALPGFVDTPAGQPVLAVVGRPNVGKSTLVNRILGSRQAVVQDVPGVTRDRVAYEATWRGRTFTIVDTGGWEARAQGLSAQVAEQAKVAVELADAVLFVVDARVGATDEDEAVARVLRRAGKPVILAANKVDDQKSEADATSLWSLGLGEPFAVSALHGRASGDLLDLVLEALPDAPPERIGFSGGPRRVALIGRPNVGKSSLLNRLAGENRALVSPVAGTTRDPVDEVIELGGKPWRFVDTAGIKRRFRESQGADYFAALRTSSALDRAEVAVVLIDASEPLTDQDLRILTMVIDAGRALVIAYNKWDLTDEERRHYLGVEIERALYSARWAPRVNISAETGRSVAKLVPALEAALASWDRRIPTGQLNAWITRLVQETPPPLRGGRLPKILFATQAGTRPPHIVLFTTRFLEETYRRFIERSLREEFGFEGTPVRVTMRIREKRKARSAR
jgi:GTPase